MTGQGDGIRVPVQLGGGERLEENRFFEVETLPHPVYDAAHRFSPA
jgi:hypothetical protein